MVRNLWKKAGVALVRNGTTVTDPWNWWMLWLQKEADKMVP